LGHVGRNSNLKDLKHGLSTGQVPVSAYVGSSKNLKDLKFKYLAGLNSARTIYALSRPTLRHAPRALRSASDRGEGKAVLPTHPAFTRDARGIIRKPNWGRKIIMMPLKAPAWYSST
jgi:hypothetical protein